MTVNAPLTNRLEGNRKVKYCINRNRLQDASILRDLNAFVYVTGSTMQIHSNYVKLTGLSLPDFSPPLINKRVKIFLFIATVTGSRGLRKRK